MAYIYKITNDINGKVYIGKTYNSIEKRFKEHCKDRLKRGYEQRPLYSAMNKYGVEHFYIELLEKTDDPEEKEKYWIEYYDSFRKGYNATRGGDGRSYVDRNIIISLWEEGKTITEIHNITSYDNGTIRKHLENNGITKEKRVFRKNEKVRKPVAMLDKETEEIIKVFSTSTDAEKFLQKPRSHQHISEVCKGKRKSAYGYKWKYI